MPAYPFHIEETDELVCNHREYINSSWWQIRKSRFASKYKKVCALCKADDKTVYHLHHLSYKRKGRERDRDLVYLCPGCHKTIHKCRPSEVARVKLDRVPHKGNNKKRRR